MSDFSWQNWNWNIQNEPRIFWPSSYEGQLTTTVRMFGERVHRPKHRIIGSQENVTRTMESRVRIQKKGK